MIAQNPTKLEKLQKFVAKGGIGTCVAIQDTLANTQVDLMFHSGEVITVLKHIKDDTYLGYCEGVVGRFQGKTVSFNGPLIISRSLKSDRSSSPTNDNNGGSTSENEYQPDTFLRPMDAKQGIQIESRSSSISSTEQCSGPSSPLLTPKINITFIDNIKDDVSSNQKNQVQISSNNQIINSSTTESNLDRSQTSMPIMNHVQNKSSLLSYNRPIGSPLIPLAHSQSRSLSLPNDSVQSTNPKRQSSAPQLSNGDELMTQENKNSLILSNVPAQSMEHVRQNSAPLLSNDQDQSMSSDKSLTNKSSIDIGQMFNEQLPAAMQRSPQNPSSKEENSFNTILSNKLSAQRLEKPLVHSNAVTLPYRINTSMRDDQRIRHNPNAGRLYDSPTSTTNSPGASSLKSKLQYRGHFHTHASPATTNISYLNSSGSKGKPQLSGDPITSQINGRQHTDLSSSSTRPSKITGNNYSSKSPHMHASNLDQSQTTPQICVMSSPVIPPQRKSSIGLSEVSDNHMSSLSSSHSTSAPPRTFVNILSQRSGSLDVCPVGTSSREISPATPPLASPLVIPRSEQQNSASTTPALSPAIIPPYVMADDDFDNSDNEHYKEFGYDGNNNDITPPMPAFIYENGYDSSTNESEVSSDEDEVKSLKSSREARSPTPDKPKKEKAIVVDTYGFVYDVTEEELPEGSDRIRRIIRAPGAEEKTERSIRLYRDREAKWINVFSSMESSMARESRKIKKLVRCGIPESVRGKSWQFMANINEYKQPGVFDKLRAQEKLPIYDVIERDIHRCYPDHIQFREEKGFGQDDLHNVLKAYAHYNPAVGYCQGMGRLVGMMLMQMPVEDSFWLLVATIERYMAGYFTPTLSQVRIDSIVFEHLLLEHDPKLAQHLADNDILPLMYMTQWFMTIFTMALPWASVLRVWDIFYFEGAKLFFRIGLAILDCTRDHILKNCPTTSEILGFILHIPHELLTPDLLLESAFRIKLKRSTIRRMTKRAATIEKYSGGVGTDSPNPIHSVVKDKEVYKRAIAKMKSIDKLKIDGIEFKMVVDDGS